LGLVPSTANGQQDELRLRGRVMQGDIAVQSGVAVLHRVSMEEAGEVDSVSVASDGGFEFVIPRPPSVSTSAGNDWPCGPLRLNGAYAVMV